MMNQPTSRPIISVSGLTKRFGELTAVDGLDLNISPGEIFGLVGPDGAGKTTTLRLLCGLLEASSGSAQVAGCDVAGSDGRLKDRIGYMPQKFGLYLDLTVAENMSFYADLFGLGGEELDELTDRLLRMTRLEPFRDRHARKLSGGMKQKLALMCALLHRPEALFLDEPTNGVDPVSRRDFWRILYQLVKEGMTVFITTAYLDEAERCNRVGLMHRGRLIQCNSPERLLTHLAETCWQVESSSPREARKLLSRRPEVLSVESSGSRLHLFLSPGGSPDELADLLESSDLGPARLTPVHPDLEDVFIALVRKQAASKQPSGEVP